MDTKDNKYESILKSKYDRSAYLDIFKNKLLPDDYIIKDESIHYDNKLFTKITYLGKSPSLELSIYEIKYDSDHDPRVTLSRESFKLLKAYGLQRALIFFIPSNGSQYRLSLVTIDLQLEGKRTKKLFSNPRRYSFLLGEGTAIHTPFSMLFNKPRFHKFEDIQKAFSVEVVNQTFYDQIATLFTQLVGGKRYINGKEVEQVYDFKLPPQDDSIRKNFVVRLLGRIVFCWFLKKKISNNGIPLIPEEILNSDNIKNNYYHNVLEKLFFEVLNTPIDKRNEIALKGDFEQFWKQVPYLNGGLFAPLNHDFYKTNEIGISEYVNIVNIPDQWLNSLFQILETYNFTIDENTPIDIELSLDPEILGRIFENLLAEVIPETEETARKSSGSYYTPRPIVEYMVSEVIREYLKSKTSIEDVDLIELMDYATEDNSLTEDQKVNVINALDDLKILDPACGSGAFPMGILQQVMLILQKVDPRSEYWFSKQMEKIHISALRVTFIEKMDNEDRNYIHKMGIIQNSIYGVDIQSIATEIARLRFFLTLIVDENIDDTKANRGINSLPNLSFKFVAADTLIDTQTDEYLKSRFQHELDNLENLRDRYFLEDRKRDIEEEFTKCQKNLFEELEKLGLAYGNGFLNKLVNWKPFEDETTDWFDPRWMFGVKNKFDIVIGNPPYIQGTVQNDLLKQYKKKYKTATYKGNSFQLFFERGLQLAKDDSFLTYITPKSFFNNKHSVSLRELLSHDNSLLFINDLQFAVFQNAKEDMAITGVQKKKSLHYNFRVLETNNLLELGQDSKIADSDSICSPDYRFIYETESSISDLIYKLKKTSNKLRDYADVYFGIQTFDRDTYVCKTKLSPFYKPVIDGANIKRYRMQPSNEYVKFTKDAIKSGGKQSIYEKHRIATRQIGIYPQFAYLSPHIYTLNTIYNVFLNESYDLPILFYLLGILNSKLISYFWVHVFFDKKATYPKIKKDFLLDLPIPEIIRGSEQPVLNLVNIILKKKDAHEDTTSEENQIDQLVYQLYDLTADEIAIVEKGTGGR